MTTDGQKAGLGEAAATATRRKQMSLQEAQMILGVSTTASLEEVTQRWQHLLEINEKHGTKANACALVASA